VLQTPAGSEDPKPCQENRVVLYSIDLSVGDDQFIPSESDQAEFAAWCAEQDAADANREPTAHEWSAHVETYLAEHDLAEVPF
jgi:hypothetical protein